jgi:glucokinase
MATDGGFFVGVDVGGTKIHAALVPVSGQIRKRLRTPTPRGLSAEKTLAAILDAVEELLADNDLEHGNIAGVGLAVPGVVDYENGQIVASPNIAISGIPIAELAVKRLGAAVALGNDVDVAVLGEQWVGVAREADTAVGIWPGTGIGGGIVVNGRMLRGKRYSSAEIGHMVIDRNGPVCGCGNRGCLEALASRTAIERDIRDAVAAGRKTVLTEWIDGPIRLVRSGMLARALAEGDELVTEILQRVAGVLGDACVSLRRLLEPEIMVLGGGLIEACGEFLLPPIERAVRDEPFLGARGGVQVRMSALGDDAGVLGAAALAMQAVGFDPLDRTRPAAMDYPKVRRKGGAGVKVDAKTFEEHFFVRANGRAKKLLKNGDEGERTVASLKDVSVKDLRRVCKGGPAVLIVAAPDAKKAKWSKPCQQYLLWRGITTERLDLDAAIVRWSERNARKAMLVLMGSPRS